MNTRKNISIALLLLLLILALAPLPLSATAGRIRFGKVSFEPGVLWNVVDQGPTLLLIPNNQMIKDHARVVVGPVRTSSAAAVIAEMWAHLSAGKQIKGSVTDDRSGLMGGNGNLYRHFAKFVDGSAAVLIIAESGGTLTPFAITGDNPMAADIAWTNFGMVMLSLKGEADTGTPPAMPGQGSVLGISGGAGGPSDLGPDPYDSINWKGPGELGYGLYDIHPIRPKTELRETVLANRSFIGSVQPKVLTFGQALANIRVWIDTPRARSEYEKLKREANRNDPFMLDGVAFAGIAKGEPALALLSLYTAYELFPNDPDTLVNLAAILAHCGMPNESLAVLKEMERRGLKPHPAVLSGDALMEYLQGFNQLMIGQTSTGKYHLHQAVNLDPFLKEAALALAVAQKLTGEEEQAEKTYYYGVWRRRPAQYMICGGTGSKEDEIIRPPLPEMFDLSQGKPGVLPQFDHPTNYAKDMGLRTRYERPMMESADEGRSFAQDAVNIGRRLSARKRTPTEVWSGYVESLIDTLDQDEIPVKKLKESKIKAHDEAAKAAQSIGQNVMRQEVALMTTPGDHTAEYRKIANDGISAFHPYAQAYDTALRRWHKTWYRYATGLTTNLGDRDWHDKEVLKIRSRTDLAWSSELAPALLGWYTEVGVCPGCDKDPEGSVEKAEHPEIGECPLALKEKELKIGLKIPVEEGSVELNFRQSCEAKIVEFAVNGPGLELPEFEASLGAFAQAEFAKNGDTTVFVGVKGDAANQNYGTTGRAGVSFTADRDGNIKSVEARTTAEHETKLGGILTVGGSSTISEDRITIVPGLAGPERGPVLGN